MRWCSMTKAQKNLLWLLAGAGVIALGAGAGLAEAAPGDGAPGDGTPAGPDPRVKRIAAAIAIAERGAAEIASGAIKRNNPGDLTDGAGNLAVYPTLGAGWQALYDQIARILNGSSPYYPGGPAMSITDVGYVYADGVDDPSGASNWAANVSSVLGVDPSTPIGQV